MNIIDEFKELDVSAAIAAGLFFFAVLGPGVLTILYFDKELFLQLDGFKLVLLAISITSPGVIAPVFASVICSTIIKRMAEHQESNIGDIKHWYQRHSINNAFSLYLFLFLSYMFSFSLAIFLWLFLFHIIGAMLFEVWHLAGLAKNPDKYPNIDV